MKVYDDGIEVAIADATHTNYIDTILEYLNEAAKTRDYCIAARSRDYLSTKIRERKMIIARDGEELAGFCYVESWENKQYVSCSGLFVAPKFRGRHIATRIKQLAFSLMRTRWPKARIYELTASSAIMHINTRLGYVPVPFSAMTHDDVFWRSCGTEENPCCVNCYILSHSARRFCVCTGMLFNPNLHQGEPLPYPLPQKIIHFIQEAEG